MTHDLLLTEQINAAFDNLDDGKLNFIEHDKAKLQMEARKNKIRHREKT
jgi:hypothetical protein